MTGVSWRSRWWGGDGIQARLSRWLVAPLILVLLVSSAIETRLTYGPLERSFDDALADTASALAAHVRADEGRLILDLSEQSVGLLRIDTRDRVFFRVLGPDGATIAGDGELPRPARTGQQTFYDGVVHGARMRGIAYETDTRLGRAVVLVAETTLKRDEVLRDMVISRVVQDVSILLLVMGVLWLGIANALRPMRRLAQQVSVRSPEDLQPLSAEGAPAEAWPLIDALNRLFRVIGETQDAQRRFIENAAHQLRTPLAGLRGQLDLVVAQAEGLRARGAAPAEVEALEHRMRRVLHAVERVTRLANQMLVLARSERTAHETASRQMVSLAALVDDAVAEHLDAALARGQDLGAEAEPARIRAVEWELRELLSNLIDNAIRYTPPGGVVTVRTGTIDDDVYLEVEDDGPGIAPPERRRAFERFYRVRDGDTSGSGLGLAIVQEIAALYRARVEILSGAGGRGCRVRVEFPRQG